MTKKLTPKNLRSRIHGHDLNPAPGAISSTVHDPPPPRTPNSYLIKRIRRNTYDRIGKVALDRAEHSQTMDKLYNTIGRLALMSENLEDRTGIESTVEIIKPLSRRKQHLVRLGRFKYGRWLNPRDTFGLAEYTANSRHLPSQSSDLVDVQFRKERDARAWVLPFVRQGDVVRKRRPLTPSRDRPNDLIIEVPQRGQVNIKSHLGGIEAFDGDLPAGQHNVPRIIGTGPDGKGTFFSPEGFKGATPTYHGERAIEGVLGIGNPENIDNQIWKTEALNNRLLGIQENILNRVAEENGVSPARDIPRPPNLPPPAY